MSTGAGALSHLKNKMTTLKGNLDDEQAKVEQLLINKDKLESQLKQAEEDNAGLNRRVTLLETDLERLEDKGTNLQSKLDECSQAADESERARKVLENRSNLDDNRIEVLEQMCKESQDACSEAERKYEEAARKLVVTESDLDRAETRCEDYCVHHKELEEQLHIVTNTLRSLEVNEDKASQREDTYEETIRKLSADLKEAESQSEAAESEVKKLQIQNDILEGQVISHKEKHDKLKKEFEESMAELNDL